MNPGYRWFAKLASICMFLTFAGSNAHAQTYTFGNASYSAPGLSNVSPPQGNAPLATADFNGDGIPDVAVAGTTSNGQALSIFLGKPDGSFAPRTDYSVQATGFTIGDFNGDGKLDLVVVAYAFGTTGSILFGNGDGTFQPPVPLNQNIGNVYSAAASADFNGDGKLDLLLLTPDFGSGSTMAILFGNGDGTFQAPATSSIPSAPYIAVADFNRDGKPDVAIAGGLFGSGGVAVLINNGNGTFKSPVNYPITGNVQALATADFNGDGKLDLVVPSGGSSASISVLLGNGDGSFANPLVYTSTLLNIYNSSIAAADLNGDGKLDVALTNSEPPNNSVAVVFGNGDGTFQSTPSLYSAGLMPAAVISLDANGDGKPDLAVAGGYGVLSYFSLTTLINRGNGSFSASANTPVLQFPYSAIAGDFNNDGHPDIVTTSDTQTGGVSVLLGKGDGTFQNHVDSSTGIDPTVMVAGDFNKDGKLDLVVADESLTSELLSTLIGKGDGTFQNKFSLNVPNGVYSLAAGDFNGDGKLDIAAVIGISNSGAVSIFLGHGDGSFAAPAPYPTGPMASSPPYHRVMVGDFNGDGKLDLAAATDNGVAVLLGNGNGTFQPFSLVPSLSTVAGGDELLALADFNGDGKLDVVKSTAITNVINVALGNGDGTFTQAAGFQIPSILDTESAVDGDFNGDGKLDLAFASQSSNVVTILFGNGDGTFSGHIEYAVPSVSSNVDFMFAADFNGDGALDMGLADFSDSLVCVFLNQPVAAFSPRALTFPAQPIGATSAQQAVTVTNSGAARLAISSVSTTGDFSVSNTCGSGLAIGKNCAANVSFAPTAVGSRTGTLSFTDSASVVPQILALTGTGTNAGFTVAIAPGSSASQTISAGQTANYSLLFTSVGGYSGTITLTCSGAPSGATCTPPAPFPLAANSTSTAAVSVTTTASAVAPSLPRFAPPVAPRSRVDFRFLGLLLGTFFLLALLTIVSGRVRQLRAIAMTGATAIVLLWAGCGGGGSGGGGGGSPSAQLSPSSLTFASQGQGSTSSAQSVTLTNSGNAALAISAISVGGTNAGDFAQTNTCSSSVASSQNCSIAVTFTPTATGSRTATLSVSDNAAGSPQSVTLSGTGTTPTTPAGTYTVTVTATSSGLTHTMPLTLIVQ